MKCPHCHQEIDEELSRCPECGYDLEEIDEPRLNIITKIFIVVGLVVLAFCGILYYTMHSNDPDYVRTKIEPDSTLADRFEVKFDTMPVDTASLQDNKDEEEQAAKVFNSIRGKQTDAEEQAGEPDVEDDVPAADITPHVDEPSVSTPSVSAPEVSAPKTEGVE